jgi:glycerophosphoryl diester phosphodiesterase
MLVSFMLILASVAADPAPDIRIIAHRGGVVDAERPEGTMASLQEAIRRGYWMVEADVRCSKDGEVVIQHDEDFRRVYGVKEDISELTWDQISKLKSKKGDQSPISLAQFAAECKGKIRIMVDIKEKDAGTAFFERMEQILKENGLLDSAYFIGGGKQKTYFKGKAHIGANRDALKTAVAAGESVKDIYFLFEHGNKLDEETVANAKSLNVPVVASVNTFHYIVRKKGVTPESDIANLRKWGVTEFQIDSVYAAFAK